MYVLLLFSVVLFRGDGFICKYELSEALNLLNVFEKGPFFFRIY